jgi:hypothetical protein
MKREANSRSEDELRSEYTASDLKGGVRGKYLKRYQKGTNLVLLAPDVARAFPSEQAVNDALRLLMNVAQAAVGPPSSAPSAGVDSEEQ